MSATPITANRDEFDDHFAALCAAFDRGYTADRREAFRTAFVGKLSAAQVARIVERMVGEAGPERMPTIRDLWQAHRAMRAPGPVRQSDQRPAISLPPWQASANVALLSCAIAYPGRDDRSGWQLARRLGEQYQALTEDGDPEATFDRLKVSMLREYARLPAKRSEAA